MASSDNASDYGEYSDAMSPGSSSEDYGYNDDDSNWQESKAKDCKAAYKIIDNNQLESLQSKAIDAVVGLLGCSTSMARTLLIFYRWSEDSLTTDIAEKGIEYVYKSAGLAMPSGASCSAGEQSAPKKNRSLIRCETCLSDVEASSCSAMDCSHSFCNDCWRQHLATQIGDGKGTQPRCMAYKCGVVCDEGKVRRLLAGDPKSLAGYNLRRLQSYMEDNSRVRFCPSVPWCGHAAEVKDDPYCEPECPCGTAFCFKCGNDAHSPCTCDIWRLWEEKITGDSETRNWIQAHTKPCPKCTKPVEKNGGCNLVLCSCGQAFCWLCGVGTGRAHTWETIDGHSCGRFKEEMDARVNEAQRHHARYMHYFQRYKEHHAAFLLETNNRPLVAELVVALEEQGNEARDLQWMLAAGEQLRAARRVLGNSYAFAFVFFGEERFREGATEAQVELRQTLFEDQQQSLENEVERLSKLVSDVLRLNELTSRKHQDARAQAAARKAAAERASQPEARQTALNSTASIEQRITKLYDVIENDLYSRLLSMPTQIAPCWK